MYDTFKFPSSLAHKAVQKHAFRQSVKPIELPTPRGSLLGLNRLAKERRDQSDIENRSRKTPRLDHDVVFKCVCDSIVSLYGG